MKNFIIIMLLGLVACSREVPVKIPIAQEACKTTVEKTSETDAKVVTPSIEALRVVDWGPQSTVVGVNPNAQPGGDLGIWIRLSSTKDLGELQLIFDDQLAKTVNVVDDQLITVAVNTDKAFSLGEKKISLIQIKTQKTIPIGFFKVVQKN